MRRSPARASDATVSRRALTTASGEQAPRLLREVASAIEPPVSDHRGKVVKRIGDGRMAVFPAPQLAFAR